MLRIIRRDTCETHKDHKRVYLIGATNENGDMFSAADSDDPYVYTKIGLSQNPVERLKGVEQQSKKYHKYGKEKTVSIFGEEVRWMPANFVLLGYTEPLPFAASVETMAQKILEDACISKEASETKIIGMKDWYSPNSIWMAAFAIFEAVDACYRDLGVNARSIKWTIPKTFPDIGSARCSIDQEYLPFLKKFKKYAKKGKVDYRHVMENSCSSLERLPLAFNWWLKETRPWISVDERARLLHGARTVVCMREQMPGIKEHHMCVEDEKVAEGMNLFLEEFKNDTKSKVWSRLNSAIEI